MGGSNPSGPMRRHRTKNQSPAAAARSTILPLGSRQQGQARGWAGLLVQDGRRLPDHLYGECSSGQPGTDKARRRKGGVDEG